MRINEIDYGAAKPIDSYGPGMFRVAGDVIEGPILMLPSGVRSWGGYGDPEAILEAATGLDVLLIGTGSEIGHVPPAFRDAVEAARIGLEAMATPSACRTFNVLLSEGRRVGAALLPV